MTTSLPDFLKTMLGFRASEAWLEWGTFQGKQFTRSNAGRASALPLPPDNEAVFYSAALFKPGTSRADQNVDRVMVLTIDDVGTKIDLTAMEMFAPMPTMKVETSQGNFQWQYAIDGGMDPDIYRLLRQHMKSDLVYGHSEAIAPSNLIRLPAGVNGKPGKETWKVKATKSGGIYTTSQLLLFFKGLPSQSPQGSSNSKPDEVANPGLLQGLVDLIPNDQPDRQRWVDVAHAIHGASDGLGFEIFASWAARWTCGIDDPAANQHLWDGICDVRIGRAWLLREAGEPEVWLQEEAKAAFDDGYTEPDEPEPAGTLEEALPEDTRKMPRRPWLYGRRLLRGYLSSTVAAGGVGKSTLTMTEAIAMATGRDLLDCGHMPREPLRVLIWNGEDPLSELKLRFNAVCKHFGLVVDDFKAKLFLLSGRDHELHTAKGVKWLKATMKANRVDVLILDPFVSTHRENENDNTAIDKIAKGWSRLAEECFCAVELVHHIRKPSNGSGVADLSVDDARGASALINASRNARVLSPMAKPEADSLGIVNRRAYFAIQHDATKANMSPSLTGASWFKFASVDMGNGDPFDDPPIDGDSVGIVESWIPSTPLASLPANIVAAQAEVAKGSYRRHSSAKGWVGEPVAKVMGLDAKTNRKAVEKILNGWIKDGWFVVVEHLDAHREMKEFVEVGKAPEGFDEVLP